ncbi:hypothetical protein Tco_1116402 [Tanacetum coccineum]
MYCGYPVVEDSNVRSRYSIDCTNTDVANGVGVRHTLHDKSTNSTFVENEDLGESNPSNSTRLKNSTQRNVKDRATSSSGGVSRASPPIGNSGEGSSFVHNKGSFADVRQKSSHPGSTVMLSSSDSSDWVSLQIEELLWCLELKELKL